MLAATPHPLSDGPLEFGRIAWAQADYLEFACSLATADWLEAGAMSSIDGRPVILQRTCLLVGGHNVMVRVWFQGDP